MLFYLPPKSPAVRMEENKSKRRTTFIIFIISLVLSIICAADTFDKASTWFWIMVSIVSLIANLISNAQYKKAETDYGKQNAALQNNEVNIQGNKLPAVSDHTEAYKREAFVLQKENESLKAQVNLLTFEKEQLEKKVTSLKNTAISEDLGVIKQNEPESLADIAKDYDMTEDELTSHTMLYRTLGENYINFLPKEYKEREEQGRPERKAQLEANGEIIISNNVDKILASLERVMINAKYPAPEKIMITEPMHLKKKYTVTQNIVDGDYTVIDLETTGLSPESNEIIELSAIRFRRFKAISSFTTLVKPSKPIPYNVTQITGISNEDVVHAPVFEAVLDGFIEFLGTDAVVGHNIRAFDLKFLHRRGFNIEKPDRAYYDTLRIARKLIPKGNVPNHKLETLLKHFGIIRSTEHRGESDSVATGILFAVLLSKADEQGMVDDVV